MYANGENGFKDYIEAFDWYKKAAKQGNSEAQLNLGLMYAKGKYVFKDLRKAKYWINKVCENSDVSPEAIENAK